MADPRNLTCGNLKIQRDFHTHFIRICIVSEFLLYTQVFRLYEALHLVSFTKRSHKFSSEFQSKSSLALSYRITKILKVYLWNWKGFLLSGASMIRELRSRMFDSVLFKSYVITLGWSGPSFRGRVCFGSFQSEFFGKFWAIEIQVRNSSVSTLLRTPYWIMWRYGRTEIYVQG